MKKAIIMTLSIIIILLCINWFNESNFNPFDYARITDIDYTARLVDDEPGSNGKVIITERLTFDIHAASRDNLFWELWRDLPEAYVDGVKVDYKVNSVKQVYDDGDEVIYQESPMLYWEDEDYVDTFRGLGPKKWYHSKGPYSENRRQYECLMIYIDGRYRTEMVFEIEYEMYNAVLRYGDSSELYLTFYSEETVHFLDSFKGQILIPSEKMPKEGNYNAYTYGTNAHTFPFTESDRVNPGYHTFLFDLDQSQLKFKPYNEYLEFTLVSYGQDAHSFTKHASQNHYYNDEVLPELREEQTAYEALPDQYQSFKYIILIVCLIVTLITLIISFNADKILSIKHTFYKPSRTYDTYKEIPGNLDPGFAAALVFCKHKSTDIVQEAFAAVLLSLVNKKYIELVKIRPEADWLFENIKIVVTYRPLSITYTTAPEPLTQIEEQYFYLIIRHSSNDEVTMKAFQDKVSSDYENTNSFVRNVRNAIINIGIAQGYFQKADYQQPGNEMRRVSKVLGSLGMIALTIVNFALSRTRLDLAFGAFCILGIGFLLSAVLLKKISSKCVLLTQFGEDEYAKWRGLYNYFNSESFMKDKTVEDLGLWEQFLIYATAFGVSEKVSEALNVKCPEASLSPVLGNPYYRTRHFHHYHTRRRIRTATRSASFSARSGGHGGYGGGGRGGGGGGGGH